jgi:hypothetical protein
LVEFIKENESALTSQAHGMVTTSEVLRTSVADDDLMAILTTTTRFLTRRMKSVLKDREMFHHEREKCLDIIQVGNDDREKPLDLLLLQRLDSLPKIMEQHQKDLTKKDLTMERQRTMIKEMENEIEYKEKEIVELKQQIAHKTGEIGALQSKILQETKTNDELERDSSGENLNGKTKSKKKTTKKNSTSSK